MKEALALESDFSPRTVARMRRLCCKRFLAASSASSRLAEAGYPPSFAAAAEEQPMHLSAPRNPPPPPSPSPLAEDDVLSALVVAVRRDENGVVTEELVMEEHSKLLDVAVAALDNGSKALRLQAMHVLRAVADGKSAEAKRRLLDLVKEQLADVCCGRRVHFGLQELLELVEEVTGQQKSVAVLQEASWIARFCLVPLCSDRLGPSLALQLARTLVCICTGNSHTLLRSLDRVSKACNASGGGMATAELLVIVQALINATSTVSMLNAAVSVALPLLQRTSGSLHFLASDRALCVLRSPRFLLGLSKHGAVPPKLLATIQTTAAEHWDVHVRASALSTLRALRAIDSGAFSKGL